MNGPTHSVDSAPAHGWRRESLAHPYEDVDILNRQILPDVAHGCRVATAAADDRRPYQELAVRVHPVAQTMPGLRGPRQD